MIVLVREGIEGKVLIIRGVGEVEGAAKGTVFCEIRMRPQLREDAVVIRGRFV